jgi:hypothetical protein
MMLSKPSSSELLYVAVLLQLLLADARRPVLLPLLLEDEAGVSDHQAVHGNEDHSVVRLSQFHFAKSSIERIERRGQEEKKIKIKGRKERTPPPTR